MRLFNTLKNQGYNLGHNYGLGEKHLAVVFTMLMMLAFSCRSNPTIVLRSVSVRMEKTRK